MATSLLLSSTVPASSPSQPEVGSSIGIPKSPFLSSTKLLISPSSLLQSKARVGSGRSRRARGALVIRASLDRIPKQFRQENLKEGCKCESRFLNLRSQFGLKIWDFHPFGWWNEKLVIWFYFRKFPCNESLVSQICWIYLEGACFRHLIWQVSYVFVHCPLAFLVGRGVDIKQSATICGRLLQEAAFYWLWWTWMCSLWLLVKNGFPVKKWFTVKQFILLAIRLLICWVSASYVGNLIFLMD